MPGKFGGLAGGVGMGAEGHAAHTTLAAASHAGQLSPAVSTATPLSPAGCLMPAGICNPAAPRTQWRARPPTMPHLMWSSVSSVGERPPWRQKIWFSISAVRGR